VPNPLLTSGPVFRGRVTITPLTADARRDLLEVLDDRHQRRSTLVISQLAVEH